MGTQQPIKIALIGAGAVGTFYCAHFARVGAQVTIVTRSPAQYQSNIRIESCDGSFLFAPTNIVGFDDVNNEDFDLVVFATKALPTIHSVALVAPFMSKKTRLLVIQNGLLVESDFLEAFQQPIYRGLAFICSQRLSVDHIHHMDYGHLTFGQCGSSSNDPLMTQLFEHVGFSNQMVENINYYVWEKLIWNVAFNPLSVVHGCCTTSDLLKDSAIRNHIKGLMQDVVRLAAADGCVFKDDIIDYKLSQTEQMTPYRTSMCLDALANRPLEIEAILGNVVRFAQTKSIDVSTIVQLYQQFK